MNIVSTVVGLSILGAAAPMIMDMSLAPVIAQKRTDNFGVAESLAVTYSAKNEGRIDLVGDVPDECSLEETESRAYTIECSVGEGRFLQTVSRSFRLLPLDTGDTDTGIMDSGRVFEFDTPERFSGHQCPNYDQWGVYGYNDQWTNMDACLPQAIWDKYSYLNSNPDDWLYDVNNHNGWGDHPDYIVSCDNDGNNGHGDSGGYDCSNPGNG